MSLRELLTPLQRLELEGAVSDSGEVDRLARHQSVAVPHWVETREGCLVGAYSSWRPVKEAVAEIKRLESSQALSPGDGLELDAMRRTAATEVNFQPKYRTIDEKVAAEFVAADRDDVVWAPVARSGLTAFLGLHARKPASVEAFAQRRGMLHTYTEGFVSNTPLAETAVWKRHYLVLPEHIRVDDEDNGVDAFEPIAYWQAFSKFAFLTLQLARQLDDDQIGSGATVSLEDWRFFEHFLDRPVKNSAALAAYKKRHPAVSSPDAAGVSFLTAESLDKLQEKFCTVLNELQDIGDVKLELRWDQSPPALEFRVTGLVSVIAAQLLMAASQRENFVLCRECQLAFRPWQQPLTGNFDLYCEECRNDGAPQRNAVRRYRASKKNQSGESA